MMSKAIVMENFNMNVYLYNNYSDDTGDKYSDFTLYDKNTEKSEFDRYATAMKERANSKQFLENNAQKLATLILNSIDNGTENDSIRRKTMLAKYDELKNELDFNDSDQAPKYAKQIVDSYK